MSQSTETDFAAVRREIAKWLLQMNPELAAVYKIKLAEAAMQTTAHSRNRLAALREISKKAKAELCLQSFMAY